MAPRLVPWAHFQEWLSVYQQLYSEDTHLQQQGLKRVRAWMSRGRTPVAVESTAALLQLKMYHFQTLEYRLVLSMALVRFVNGIVDQYQKGNFAASAQQVAADVGLPSWFVELRHAATHDRLPTLNVLTSARDQALVWLRDNYWIPQEKYESLLIRDLTQQLKVYKEQREQYLATKKGMDVLSMPALNEIKRILSADMYPQLFVPLLTKNGAMFSKKMTLETTPPVEVWEPLIEMLESAFPGTAKSLVETMFGAWILYLIPKYAPDLQVNPYLLPHLSNPSVGFLAFLERLKTISQLHPLVNVLIEHFKGKLKPRDISQQEIDQAFSELVKKTAKKEHVEPTEGKWTLLTDWKPCPIGTLNGHIPSLDLDPLAS
ncbi:Las1-like-domain-containing protein [Gorgonomyces haynaldii]|nr:Las1-like-domain-containing protein [Gorgonomyces haynaldii]